MTGDRTPVLYAWHWASDDLASDYGRDLYERMRADGDIARALLGLNVALSRVARRDYRTLRQRRKMRYLMRRR